VEDGIDDQIVEEGEFVGGHALEKYVGDAELVGDAATLVDAVEDGQADGIDAIFGEDGGKHEGSFLDEAGASTTIVICDICAKEPQRHRAHL
jgi:hypothetical protein